MQWHKEKQMVKLNRSRKLRGSLNQWKVNNSPFKWFCAVCTAAKYDTLTFKTMFKFVKEPFVKTIIVKLKRDQEKKEVKQLP